MDSNTIWTIGHSTNTLEEFISRLQSFDIEMLADIRSYPGSRRFPHFNKDALSVSLPQHKIAYIHLPELGGRRRPIKDSQNTAWKNEGFRGYADYMETAEFLAAIHKLQSLAANKRLAYMCSEAVWWRCHRSLVSDYLKHAGWTVIHILNTAKSEVHPYTSPARIVNGQLLYTEPFFES